jgi:hypothetical protein
LQVPSRTVRLIVCSQIRVAGRTSDLVIRLLDFSLEVDSALQASTLAAVSAHEYNFRCRAQHTAAQLHTHTHSLSLSLSLSASFSHHCCTYAFCSRTLFSFSPNIALALSLLLFLTLLAPPNAANSSINGRRTKICSRSRLT